MCSLLGPDMRQCGFSLQHSDSDLEYVSQSNISDKKQSTMNYSASQGVSDALFTASQVLPEMKRSNGLYRTLYVGML